MLRVSDLSRAIGDNLIMRVRKKLRQDYGYPAGDNIITDNNTGQLTTTKSKNGKKIGKSWNIQAVHTLPTGNKRNLKSVNIKVPSVISTKNLSTSSLTTSLLVDNNLITTASTDNICVTNTCVTTTSETPTSTLRQCDLNFGNAAFSTGTLGLIMSSVAVNAIATNNLILPRKNMLLKHLLRNS